MKLDDSAVSCGVEQLHEVSSITLAEFKEWLSGRSEVDDDFALCPPGSCKECDEERKYVDPPIIKGMTLVFSDNIKGNGKSLAKWIRKYNLGTLVGTGWAKNPQSGNKIQTWLWRWNGRQIPSTKKKASKK